MANKRPEIDCSPFTNSVCPTPSVGGDWGNFGEAVSGAPAPTKADTVGVQFLTNSEGAKTGKVDFGSVGGRKPGGPGTDI